MKMLLPMMDILVRSELHQTVNSHLSLTGRLEWYGVASNYRKVSYQVRPCHIYSIIDLLKSCPVVAGLVDVIRCSRSKEFHRREEEIIKTSMTSSEHATLRIIAIACSFTLAEGGGPSLLYSSTLSEPLRKISAALTRVALKIHPSLPVSFLFFSKLSAL